MGIENNNDRIEQVHFKVADKLRKNIDATEYKHVVLGLIFLKHISDSFEELYDKLSSGEGEFEFADPEDIQKIADTYHNWREPGSCAPGNYDVPAVEKEEYKDIKGFCKSTSIEKVRELDYVLTTGRYVGMAEIEDDFDFKERFMQLKAEFEEQIKEEAELNKKILINLGKVEIDPEFTCKKEIL